MKAVDDTILLYGESAPNARAIWPHHFVWLVLVIIALSHGDAMIENPFMRNGQPNHLINLTK